MANADLTIGFIGYGNMAQAMAQGLVSSGVVRADQIVATTPHFDKLEISTKKLGVRAVRSAQELVELSDIVVVAVKPQQVEEALKPVLAGLSNDQRFIVSIVAGYTHSYYENLCSKGTHIVCAIPNTPIAVRKGILVTETQHSLSVEQYQIFQEVFRPVALIEEVSTDQVDIASTVAGCTPAFTAMYMEALADAAVKYGLSRQSAYRVVAQMLEGTGALYLDTETHPGIMKDQVTSPGGTTIRGVAALEQAAFRGAVIAAIDAIELR